MKLLFLMISICLFSESMTCLLSNSSYGHQRTFEDIEREIANYSDVAEKIIKLAVYGKAQNRSYERLALFVDTFGPRLSGSRNLELAIQYMEHALRKDDLENVHLEPVKIPHWERGEESAMMIEPYNHTIAMLGLGGSVATPPEGITAEVLVVSSFDDLHKKAHEASGKIIVYNQRYINYGKTVLYRLRGAVEAAKLGAKASLIRSITPFSINSPHTGMQAYDSAVPQIPTACISIEDAELMARLFSRGTKIVVTLKMGAKTYPDADSFNTVAEITGSKYPEQVVLISGHLDSWDVGQGAMDDGGGAFISWEALSLIKDLGLRPKRTLRLVLWTGEEQGGIGAEQYYKLHKVNISNFDMVMESDEGTFTPTGLAFTGSPKAHCIMKEIMKHLKLLNITNVFEGGGGTDINYWIHEGIPGASLSNDITKYFWFHHSQGDTVSVQDPVKMNLCAALWTVVSYVIADMEEKIPV
ncbi:carboxypeptidase Q [Notechis scutatus]|uniref:Carboxypeptidase Q n=1 Tax=Notechis scutatus TaxID=8663 RepID=A0A6J1W1Z6_9SAUR|nr:carboxypeptidase Q [Notechis scutatus]